jgi:acyl carrier protein
MRQLLFGEQHSGRGAGLMRTETEIRQALRDWIAKTNGKMQPDQLDDETPIIEQRIISSLQVMDLIFFIEKLSNKSIEVESLKVGVFRNINAIYDSFFGERVSGSS